MTLEQIKTLVEQIWDYELNLETDRVRFMHEISNPIEEAIASDNKAVINYLLSIYPVERFFLQIAIRFGYENNPAAEVLCNKLAEDEKYNNSVCEAIESKCGLKVFCGNINTCAIINENLVDGISLTPKEVDLYKKLCKLDLSEYDDIAEHCREINATWDPLEMAVIIAHSDKTLTEKHTAWRKLMQEYNGIPFMENFSDDNFKVGLFNQLQRVIEYNELFIKILKAPEQGAFYQCTCENENGCAGLHCLYSSFDEALAVRLKGWTRDKLLEKGFTINMYKILPGYEGYLMAEIDCDGNVLELSPYGETHGWDDDLPNRPVCIGDMFSIEFNDDGTTELVCLVEDTDENIEPTDE